MPSASLYQWQTVRAATLDEIAAAHESVGGRGRGRRYATQQINQAYVVLLSLQFQGFCRDLHTECSTVFVQAVPIALQSIMKEGLLRDRRLDKGNPNPGNLGSDFGRFGILFWQEVYARNEHNKSRRVLLDEMNEWRNAIAHQDFERVGGALAAIQLQKVRRYRDMTTLERAVRNYKPTIHVGQKVRFDWGVSTKEGVVIEDRGPLGGNGKQVVRIRYFADYAGDGNLEPVETETAAENVEVIG